MGRVVKPFEMTRRSAVRVALLGLLGGLVIADDVARAETITFEGLSAGVLVRDQYQAFGLRVSGAGPFSGVLLEESSFGVENFGNSPSRVMHIGARNEATTLTFVDPNTPQTVLGATSVGIRVGDGNADAETVEVTYRSASGAVLKGPVLHTTTTDGLTLFESSQSLGAPIGFVELNLALSSASGMALDDVSYELAWPTTVYDFESADEAPMPGASLSAYGSPAVNASGAIAYEFVDAAGNRAIRASERGILTDIASAALGQFDGFGDGLQPDINDAGDVLFFATTTTGSEGFWIGDGSAVSKVVEDTDGYSCFACDGYGGSVRQEGALTNAGDVVFSASDSVGRGVFRWAGGSITALARLSIPTPGVIGFQPMLRTTEHGLVAFIGRHFSVGPVVAVTDDGAAADVIWASDGGFTTLHSPIILNEGGRVGMVLENSAPTHFEIRVLDALDGTIEWVAASSGSTYSVFDSERFSINDADEVAFWATRIDGRSGIWTSRNLAVPVILTQDALFGSTVDSIRPGNRSLNARGEIAFAYELADGRKGIAKAFPVRECANGLDDDGDGVVDLADPGCDSPGDTSEKSLGLACDDSLDNDGDGLIDFPADGGCTSLAATTEVPEPGFVLSLAAGAFVLIRLHGRECTRLRRAGCRNAEDPLT